MLGSPAGPGGTAQRGFWPLAPTSLSSTTNFSAEGYSKYGIYSFLPGSPAIGSALYSHNAIGRFTTGSIQSSSPGAEFHAHKDSIYASSTGYTFGAPTPPPGSPYSPVPVTQFLAKGFNSNIILHHPSSIHSTSLQHQTVPHATTVQHLSIPQHQTSPHHQASSVQQQQHLPETLQKGLLKQLLPCSIETEEKFSGTCSKSCLCCASAKFPDTYPITTGGCSRTNPIDWNSVSIKKEPNLINNNNNNNNAEPCMAVKIEACGSPQQKTCEASPPAITLPPLPPVVTSNGNIPVGIAVARQRIHHQQQQHHQEVVGSSPVIPAGGLLTTVNSTQIKEVARISSHSDSGGMAACGAGGGGGGTLLHCPSDQRNGAGFVSWPVGGAHNSAFAAPTLWQYPAHLPMEPLMPMPVPFPPVGFQLVRDHTTGGLLLLPTTGVEQVQQTVVWPSYHSTSSHVMLPPSLPPPPLQLLGSSDYLQTTNTTLHHQHSSHQSTRLLALASATDKTKLAIPSTTIIKIESEADIKGLQASSAFGNTTGTVFANNQNVGPLVTTHVIYQHPTNLLVSQTPNVEPTCTLSRSQGTSPVACLTPPPETSSIHEDEFLSASVQDASNQTEEQEETNVKPVQNFDVPEENVQPAVDVVVEVEEEEEVVKVPDKILEKVKEDTRASDNESVVVDEELEVKKEQFIDTGLDLTGLELLSNSIAELENQNQCKSQQSQDSKNDEVVESLAQMTLVDKPAVEEAEFKQFKGELAGLDLLCALAEQRIREEGCSLSPRSCSLSPKGERKEHLALGDMKSDELKSDSSIKTCTCKDDSYKTYKTKESEQVVKKFLASKSQSYCCFKGEWPCMNAMELDMRMRLADLQRKYREKQKELSKLKPKKCTESLIAKKCRIRKRSCNSDKGTPPPPCLLDVTAAMAANQSVRKPQELLKPPVLRPYDRPVSAIPEPHSPDHIDASKKRKVGRPKKLVPIVGIECNTETIVAKKPKKTVNYFEPKVENQETKKDTFEVNQTIGEDSETDEALQIKDLNEEQETAARLADLPEFQESVTKPAEQAEECSVEEISVKDTNRCALTLEHLEQSKLRVLTAMGGLFYAGRLNAVEPPDVYSITLDGERGNRPHIMSTEEILRDAILEISPSNTEDLTPGTRLCAYWSQQYRCLYPGSVADPETPNAELDSKFVSVEFDDGDSGRIAIEDIRLLPPDYPIIEYDPNPLLSLCKRRRRTSTTDERRSTITNPPSPPEMPILELGKENLDNNNQDNNNLVEPIKSQHKSDKSERKKLKKKKRDKRLYNGDQQRKKRKKRKCSDSDNCKHRKHHKKHRKHRKHHHSKEGGSKKRSLGDGVVCQKEKRRKLDRFDDVQEDLDLEIGDSYTIMNPMIEDPIVENCRNKNSDYQDPSENLRMEESQKSHPAKSLRSDQELSSFRISTTPTKDLASEDFTTKDLESKHPKEELQIEDFEADVNETESEDPQSKKRESSSAVLLIEDQLTIDVPEAIDEPSAKDPPVEVTIHDILECKTKKVNKKFRDRQESCESRSKMSAFLPARQLWGWSGKGYKRPKTKGRSRKQFFRAIQRGKETIQIGDSAVFLSTGRPDRPYIGRIEAMWESCGTMVVRVKWFYHPEETVGRPLDLKYPGALFESPHVDENDVQTISHKCEVLSLKDYIAKLGNDPQRYATIYDNNDIYYLAGYYDPTVTTLKMEQDIPLNKSI